MKRALGLLLLLSAACGPAVDAERADMIERMGAFIAGAQLDVGDADGAIVVHPSTAALSVDGVELWRVVPYDANLGVRGLLRAGHPAAVDIGERWARWYVDHLGADPALPGRMYDRWVEPATGSLARCPAPPIPCRFDDATDSAAATFLSFVDELAARGGDVRALRDGVLAVADTLLALRRDDGLTIARPE